MPAPADIAGHVFERLTALRSTRNAAGRLVWVCKCSCGNETEASVNDLRKRNTRSCGCLRSESITAHSFRHGQSHMPERAVWRAMIHRCDDPGNARYGGRGITVCARWRNSFDAFLEDMGERPSPKAELDREDNDGNYAPGNCRWVGKVANVNNRENSRFLELNGRRQTVTQWAREIGCSSQTLFSRLGKGWSDEETLTTPVATRNKGKSDDEE